MPSIKTAPDELVAGSQHVFFPFETAGASVQTKALSLLLKRKSFKTSLFGLQQHVSGVPLKSNDTQILQWSN